MKKSTKLSPEVLERAVRMVFYARYTERQAETGIVPSVGSWGDSYDSAPVETINGLYKAAVIHWRGPWKSIHVVEPQRSNGSVGSTISDCVTHSVASRQPKLTQATIAVSRYSPCIPDKQPAPSPPHQLLRARVLILHVPHPDDEALAISLRHDLHHPHQPLIEGHEAQRSRTERGRGTRSLSSSWRMIRSMYASVQFGHYITAAGSVRFSHTVPFCSDYSSQSHGADAPPNDGTQQSFQTIFPLRSTVGLSPTPYHRERMSESAQLSIAPVQKQMLVEPYRPIAPIEPR